MATRVFYTKDIFVQSNGRFAIDKKNVEANSPLAIKRMCAFGFVLKSYTIDNPSAVIVEFRIVVEASLDIGSFVIFPIQESIRWRNKRFVLQTVVIYR